METFAAKKIEVEQVEQLLLECPENIIVQVAPAVRVALGELFSMPLGQNCQGKMITALKKIGFQNVFDTDFGADITIVEEANEFISKIRHGEKLPMFSSCCPGWINNALVSFRDVLPQISTTKSPVGCFGSLAKRYFAKKNNVSVDSIYVVSIVPCLLKKAEAQAAFNKTEDIFDVDFTWTTKDLAMLIKERGIDFSSLEESSFDNPLSSSSGGGKIFGKAGGVSQSLIRALYYYLEKREFTDKITFEVSPAIAEVQECTLSIASKEYKFARTNIVGANKILKEIRAGNCDYSFVEVMACMGGCVMGAGQPAFNTHPGKTFNDVRIARKEALEKSDVESEIKCAPMNLDLIKLYDYLSLQPYSPLAKKYLHRDYSKYGK